jgi:hypothetical protein
MHNISTTLGLHTHDFSISVNGNPFSLSCPGVQNQDARAVSPLSLHHLPKTHKRSEVTRLYNTDCPTPKAVKRNTNPPGNPGVSAFRGLAVWGCV